MTTLPGFEAPTSSDYPRPCCRCEKGYYCPMGTSDKTSHPCPAGTYSDSEALSSAGQCTVCPAAKVRLDWAQREARFYCNLFFPPSSPGEFFPLQACLEGSTSAGILPCSLGHYCPPGWASLLVLTDSWVAFRLHPKNHKRFPMNVWSSRYQKPHRAQVPSRDSWPIHVASIRIGLSRMRGWLLLHGR